VLRGVLGLDVLHQLQLADLLMHEVVARVRGQSRAEDGERHQRQHAQTEREPGAETEPAVRAAQPGDHSAARLIT
jgi:hypothetical protein